MVTLPNSHFRRNPDQLLFKEQRCEQPKRVKDERDNVVRRKPQSVAPLKSNRGNSGVGTNSVCTKTMPFAEFRCGGKRFVFENHRQFWEPAAQEKIQAACLDASNVPTFFVADLLSWPIDECEKFFQLVGGLQADFEVNFGKGQREDLLAAILELWSGPNNPERCSKGEQVLICAAALATKGDEKIAASLICKRGKELGIKGLLPQVIAKRIRERRAKSHVNSLQVESDDPQQLAERYLAELRLTLGLEEGTRPLHYYQSDFFRWTGKLWLRTLAGEFEAELTRFLQNCGLSVRVSKSLVANVIVNLSAICLVKNWETTSLPLWLPSAEGEAVPSPYLAFENQLVHLPQLLAQKQNRLDGCGSDSETILDGILESDPRHFSPICLPYAFEPESPCPRWQIFLNQILPRQGEGDERQAVLQEAFGYCLLTGRETLQLERFFILYGNGANGKSTVLKLLELMLGTSNVSHVPLSSFDGDFHLFQIVDKLANIDCDMNRPERVAEGVLKAVVSGEGIQVNRKYRDPLTIYPTAKLFFATNELPSFGDRSDGIWRRAIILPFLKQIPSGDRDPGLLTRLKSELPGILNWSLEGARRLLANKRFTSCQVSAEAARRHREACDSALSFMEHCVYWEKVGASRPRIGSPLTAAARFQAYRKYCEDCLGARPLGRARFDQRATEYESERARQATPEAEEQQPFLRLDYLNLT